MFLYLFSLLVAGTLAGSAVDLGNKASKLGVTFLTAQEMAKVSGCMETPIYDQKDINSLKTSALKCAAYPGNVPSLKYLNGMSMLGDFDKCLKPKNEKWQDLLGKVLPIGMSIVNPIAKKLNNTLTKCKANKKPKDKCISDGYDLLLKEITKPVVDKICKQLVNRALNQLEWTCALQIGKKIVSFAGYTCVTVVPKAV